MATTPRQDLLPKTMKAWQYNSTTGGLSKNLRLITDLPVPSVPSADSKKVLIEVHSAALNPADYKLPQIPLVGGLMIRRPAVPCMDFCGRIVESQSQGKRAASSTTSSEGSDEGFVFGRVQPPNRNGSLAQYVLADKADMESLPSNVDVTQAGGIFTAALTAYRTLASYVKAGDRVFLNGGSGGVGTFAIQIAKQLGCHVTVSCSSTNVQLVRDLGADEVVDYKTQDLLTTLSSKGCVFDFVADYVGFPYDLHTQSVKYLKKDGLFIEIAGTPAWPSVKSMLTSLLWPTLLGGTPRRFQFVGLAGVSREELAQVSRWLGEGKVKIVCDSVVDFDQTPRAFDKLQTGRASGKIIVSGIKSG